MSTPTVESLSRLLAVAEHDHQHCQRVLRITQATLHAQQQTLLLIRQLCQDHPILSQIHHLTPQEVSILSVSTLSKILSLLHTDNGFFS